MSTETILAAICSDSDVERQEWQEYQLADVPEDDSARRCDPPSVMASATCLNSRDNMFTICAACYHGHAQIVGSHAHR